jgi:hypothetical protein
VSVEIKRIGQVIDLTHFIGRYLIPIHGLDLKKTAPLPLITLPINR